MATTAMEAQRPHGDGRRHVGEAWHKRVGGLHVLKVKGSFYEMGRQHGLLLKDEIPVGAIPYFKDYVQHLMGRTLGPLSPLVWPALQQLVGRQVARQVPPFALDTIRGLADGAGLPFQEYLDGCTMPDALLWLASRLIQVKRTGPAVRHRVSLGLGCTSAIAWGDATVDGMLLHARNLDYHGVDCWPRNAAVIFHEPEAGQRYVSVASAGVGLGGVTAMNEAGLTLTVHQHMFTDRTALGGVPIGIIGDIVMREAESVKDAAAILAEHPHVGCWTYLVTDGKTREVLAYEMNPERHAPIFIPPQDSTFGYANIYLDEELGRTEMNLYGSYWRHNMGRHRKVNALLNEKKGALDPSGMASIIGDRGDPRCRIRDSIAMTMTVGSVVFRPEDGVVWVGTGEAPTSRGTYLPFSLGREDHAPDLGDLRVEDGEAAEDREAFACFRRAVVAYVDRGDVGAARSMLARAAELAPSQAIYHALHGMLALQQSDAVGAERALDAAVKLGHPDEERVASFHLWRGRARDLQKRRRDAVDDYRLSLAHHADAPVHKAARRGLSLPYSRLQAARINIDMAFADVISP